MSILPAYQLLLDPQTQNPLMIRRTSDGAMIPFDPGNRDYAEYLTFIDAGGAAAAPPPDITTTDNEDG